MRIDSKQHIWINPVVEKMAGGQYAAWVRYIEEKGYIFVECSNQAEIVRSQYHHYIKKIKIKPIIDARCPAVVDLIKQEFSPEVLKQVAPIEPILIACAHELYEKYIKQNTDEAALTIVTPCTQLADYGSKFFKQEVRFITWKAFSKEIQLDTNDLKPSSSPIPLGFFDVLDIRVEKASGEKDIISLMDKINQNNIDEIQLIELLLCKEGCHNGDGF